MQWVKLEKEGDRHSVVASLREIALTISQLVKVIREDIKQDTHKISDDLPPMDRLCWLYCSSEANDSTIPYSYPPLLCYHLPQNKQPFGHLQHQNIMSQYDYHTRNHPGLNKTPPDIRPNDLRHISLWKQDGDDTPIGLIVEKKAGTKEYYVKEITEGGLLQQRHANSISVGDRIVKLNDKPIEEEFTSVWDVNNHIKKQTKLKLHIYRTGFHLAQEQNPWGKADYSVGNAPSKSTSNNSAAPAIPPAPKKYSPPKKAEQAASATETQSTTPTNASTPKQPETKQDQKQPAEGTTGGSGDNSSCCVLL